MRQRTTVGLLVALVVAAAACGEEQYFDIMLQEPHGGDCPAHNDFAAYSVLVWQGDNDFLGCLVGECTVAGQSARECLAAVATPALETGRSARVKVMLFEQGPPNAPPLWCGDGVSPEIDLDITRFDVALECEQSCESQGCQPLT